MVTFRRARFYLLTLYLLFLVLGCHFYWSYQHQSLLDEHQAQLDRFASHISAKLDKYAHLPQLLSKDKELVQALLDANNPAQIEITNRYLQQVNNVIQAADTYLLDNIGTTIATSNWNLPRSFISRNFAWRPYFANAITGKASQYYALGSTSGQRGYYYSYPVIYAAEIIGVIVIKMDLSAIEENWKSKQSYFVATDPLNVIFMSSNNQWLFKSLTTLNEAERNTILNSRQYLDKPIRSLGLVGDLSKPVTELINPYQGWLNGDVIISTRPLPTLQLNIRVLTPKMHLFWATAGFALVLSMVFLIGYLVMLLLHHRQLKQRQFEQLQSEAKQKLEFLVMERTAELQAQVHERTKTEHALRQTQDELIQAAKLAILGQMSASISHELNNPLAAIRSFADNGRRFLNRDKFDRVDENLERISKLTDRMAKISDQLKSFARKSESSERHLVTIGTVLRSAEELLAPQIKSSRVQFTLTPYPHDIQVEVNPIQLEQVVINLVNNALQAVAEQIERVVIVSCDVEASLVLIHIDDNGPGIAKEKIERLFEPFYTTKKNGLGLGLSISQQILQAMNGDLSVSHNPMGGARFTLTLPRKDA
ncbi:ATP-binding protein [Vibrio sp. NTOU-M3]|uniref:sensor histidine kinase n=1 Tax=Vibrio sp. NTOU-M3 TaxID=3234954 RepID=UPI00349F61A9